MSDNKLLIIHFNNGTRMEVTFPTQVKNSMGAVLQGLKRILESDKLLIQTDEQVIVVPWSSVKYLEAASMPSAALPFGAIKGARIVASDRSGPQ